MTKTNAEYYAQELVEAFLVNDRSDCYIRKHSVFKRDNCDGIGCRECKQKTEEWLKAPYEGAHAPKTVRLDTRISKFLEIFPNARLYKHGVPTACVRDVFGDKEQPTCAGLTCRQCWNAVAKEISHVETEN